MDKLVLGALIMGAVAVGLFLVYGNWAKVGPLLVFW